jgi:glycosyltransferase involved in cell wall biosynthesis
MVGGEAMPSARPMLRKDVESVFGADAAGDLGVVAFPALGRWCFSPSLYQAAMRNVRDADFVTLHSMYSFPVLAGYLAAKRHNKPFGLWPHGVFAPVQRKIGRTKKAAYDAAIARHILNDAAVLFYSADGERDEAESLGLRAPSVVIPHGLDTSAFEQPPIRGAFRQKHLAGHQGPVVLYLGRLNAKKGLDLLVEAMARVLRSTPDARLVIAGGGHPPSFAGDVRRWTERAGIQAATVLTGPVDEVEKVSALVDCDVFVLPSAAENFGFAMFEAMASGRPVVCSDTLNYAHEVRRYEAGIVVERHPANFAEAISTLISNPELRGIMGQNGRELVKHYSWESCGRKVELAIESVLSGARFPSDLRPEPLGRI